MEQSSYLSRPHFAALAAVTGLATAYGVYFLCTTLASTSVSNGLQRRNAVHRSRRDRPHPIVAPSDRDAEGAESDSTFDFADTDMITMTDGHNDPPQSQGLRGLLYYIAEDNAKREAYEHRGVNCDECGQNPIRNVRWHCLNCPEYDLCSSCESTTEHPKTHVFAKIKIPMPPLGQPTHTRKLWYPGDPRQIHARLNADIKSEMCIKYEFKEPSIDAFYDQFLCVANVSWPEDPSKVEVAINRRGFDKALKSERWTNLYSPNLVYDRMFAFYDTDGNGLIGFDEFVSGLAYLKGPKRFHSLERALQGYDADGDGYLRRADFLRMLGDKFAIQRLLIHDSTERQELDQTFAAMDTLRSSQPISSAFHHWDVPPGEERSLQGKDIDRFGDRVPREGDTCILDDGDEGVYHSSIPLSYMAHFEQSLEPEDERDETETTWPRPSDYGPNLSDIVAWDPTKVKQFLDNGPSHQDRFWQLAESGYNQLLDRLFKKREAEDSVIESTKKEREMWREGIDQFDISQHTAVLEEAMLRSIQMIGATNPDSSENTIHEALLEDVHNSAENEFRQQENAPRPQAAHPGSCSVWNGTRPSTATSPLAREVSLENYDEAEDASQNGFIESIKARDATKKTRTESPSPESLAKYMEHDERQVKIDERGGPGRLSYEEIEKMAAHDRTMEIRGLVKEWLEWACF